MLDAGGVPSSRSNGRGAARARALLVLTGGLLLASSCRSSDARLELRDAHAAVAPSSEPAPGPRPAAPGQEATAKPEEKPAPPPPAEKTPWTFDVMLYAWLTGVQGTVFGENLGLELQRSFSDLVEDLEFGGSLRAEAHKDAWSILFDSTYFDLGAEPETPTGNADVDIETWFLELDLGYTPKTAPTLCFLLGARVAGLDQSVSLPTLGESEASTTLVDPIIGARGTWKLGEHFVYSLRGDIGGFGVSSEFTAQVDTYFRWAFSRPGGLVLGYRMYTYDIDNDDVNSDLRFAGPTFGLDFHF